MSVLSMDERGAPRLIRSVIPMPPGSATSSEEMAREHLAELAPVWTRGSRPAETRTIGVVDLRAGAKAVSLIQHVGGIEIHDGNLRVLLHRDGSLAAVSGTVRSAPSTTREFRLTPTGALTHALEATTGGALGTLSIREGQRKGDFVHLIAEASGLRVEKARAKPVFFPAGDELIAAWSVELFARHHGRQEALRYLIADDDGRVLRRVDLIYRDAFTYRVFAARRGQHRPFDGPHRSFNPHPTGVPDGSYPPPIAPNLVVMEAFNGEGDPWLASNATTTLGNNVDAYAERDELFGLGSRLRPRVRFRRLLRDRYDLNREPLADETQAKAATTNLFYLNNWLHDWWYDSGFTEVAGNAQLSNLGRGGIEGDRLEARAQSGALLGFRNNAFAEVPGDGMAPSINMFLSSGETQHSLNVQGVEHETSYVVLGPRNFHVGGDVVLIDDGTDAPTDGCQPIINDVAGKIALIGDSNEACADGDPIRNARDAGALGAIIASLHGTDFPATGAVDASLPALTISIEDGEAIAAALALGPVLATLDRTSGVERDGSLDTSIVAHEWGHYLHLRLNPCEAGIQCVALSEGWADFVALHTLLHAPDDTAGTFAIGIYSTLGLVADPGYFGSRRYPYSIDRTKNDLSFRHIADDQPLPTTTSSSVIFDEPNSEEHNSGEIWATMLWDAYAALLAEHSYAEARRRMSDYAVAGMMMAPASATFTEARDGILSAVSAFDTEDMLVIASAFAGRGAGTCAVAPPRSSFDNVGVIESGTLSGRIEASTPALTDDAVSCDHDDYLDPGEQGTLRMTVSNSGVTAVENVKVTLASTSAGVILGAPVVVGTMEPFTSADIEIPVTIDAAAPVDGNLDIEVQVDGDGACADTVLHTVHQRLGVDDEPAVSTIDTIEARITPWVRTGTRAEELWARTADSSGGHAWFGANADFASDTQLVSPPLEVSAVEPLVVSLSHRFDLEAKVSDDSSVYFDGAVIELSTDGGASFQDVTMFGVDATYRASVSECCDNPLAGRPALSALSASYPTRDTLSLDFGTQFAGQAVQLRFRIGTDFCCAGTGWELDDIAVSGIDNTPFPAVVAESSICQESGAAPSSAIAAVRRAPSVSLQE